MGNDPTRWLIAALLALGLARSGAPAHADPPMKDPSPTERSAVVAGNTAFAIDLFQQLRSESGNLFFSPFSLSTALGMTYAGARTHTEREMAEVLHFDLPQNRFHPAMGRLANEMETHAPHVAGGEPDPGEWGSDAASTHPELWVSNQLWAQHGLPLQESFQQTNRAHYGAKVRHVDFAQDTRDARRIINQWVSCKTRERIPELLHPGDVDSASRLVLTNAVYFRGFWGAQFDVQRTAPHSFAIGKRRLEEVQMMWQTASFSHAQMPDFTALELPYQESDLAMVVLLPNDLFGLEQLQRNLTPDLLIHTLSSLRERRVRLGLPRLQLRARFDLAKTLTGMGMASAFGSDADFSGMTGKRDLFIDKVIHEAEVEIDEEGSEASAATAVVMKLGASPSGASAGPIEFVADHPFLFLIRDRASGSILFIGRVVEP